MDGHPTIVKVDSEKMRALEELAATSMKVSEGHNALQDLQGLESAYILERESKAGAAVDRVLAESEDILRIASENNESVRKIATDTNTVVDRVVDLFNAVKGVMVRFDEKTAAWEENMAIREKKLADEKNGLILQKQMLDGERKSIDALSGYLNDQEARIDSKRQEVNAMITNKNV